MLLSIRWIEELLGARLDINKLPRTCLKLGMEIENQQRLGPAGVVIGRIDRITPHPKLGNLDRLEIDAGRPIQIVSAAKNVKAGDRVLVCPAGAKFGEQTIQSRDFEGVRSEGMLVSEQELGLAEKSEGVIVADRGKEGEPFDQVFDDLTVEVKAFPNRPDWLSMIGICRELAIALGVNFQPPFTEAAQSNRTGQHRVQIKDLKGCPRYTARIFEGVRIQESPFGTKWRLHCMGMNSINNVVDATNIMMLLTGQPLHPFDLDKLRGGIAIRRSRKEEEFTTLEGTVLKLDHRDLVICDDEGVVALAGIVGGRGSEISTGTKRVLLESANFDPALIAHTSRRLNIRTEASARFEEGADLAVVDEVSRMTAEYLKDSCRELEYVAAGKKALPKKVRVSVPRLNERLALSLSDAQVKTVLKKAQIAASGARTLKVSVPHYRRDLAIEEDVFEEVARIYGYMNIPETPQQKWIDNTLVPEKNRRHEESIRHFLAGRGFCETYNLSLVASRRLDEIGFEDYVRVKNPLNERFDALRPSLLPGLADTANYNLSKGNRSLKLFEIGNALTTVDPFQEKRLAVIMGGDRYPGLWRETDKMLDYYDAKGTVEALFELLRIGQVEFKSKPAKGLDYAVAVSVSGTELGCLGGLKPEFGETQFFAFELALDRLWPFITEPFYIPPGRFPANTRDLSFLVDEGVTAPAVIGLIRKVGGPVLEEVNLFDYYVGKNLPAGKKSYGFRLYFRAPDRTLTDQEVDSFVRKVVDEVVEKHRAQLRGKEDDWTN